jgi:hypothetical protein
MAFGILCEPHWHPLESMNKRAYPFFDYIIDRVGNKASMKIKALPGGDLVNRESRSERWERKKEHAACPGYGGVIMQTFRRSPGMRIASQRQNKSAGLTTNRECACEVRRNFKAHTHRPIGR